jgi:hypothetical protein
VSNDSKPFGRTGIPVARVWREQVDGAIRAEDWTGLVVHPEELDRRGGSRLRDRVAEHGRPFDFLLTRGLLANDLKIGWPLHRLQQFRDEKLCRYFVIETEDPLEAEWITTNAPVHGVVIRFDADDLSARYRVFDAAVAAGMALVARAKTAEVAAMQLAVPQLVATLLSPGVEPPSAAVAADDYEALWAAYAAAHAEPSKLRGGHPPDFGT